MNSMVELVKIAANIQEMMENFKKEADKGIQNGNKTAAKRSRKISSKLEIEMRLYRKLSIEIIGT